MAMGFIIAYTAIIIFADTGFSEFTQYFIIGFITLIFSYFVEPMPLRRIINCDGTKEYDLVEPIIGVCVIRWNQSNLKTFNIWNNAILFLCITDESNKPISQMICIRVKKKKGNYIITRIDERIDINYVNLMVQQGGNQKLYIFNETGIIGEVVSLINRNN